VTSYAICALSRSGSWLLTFGLEDTGLAGRPRPYLCGLPAAGPAGQADHLPGQTRLDRLRATLRELRHDNESPAGVFGIKLESSDLDEVLAWVRGDGSFTGGPAALLAELLPGLRYIYLVRRDKTRQAISVLRGLATHQWMRPAPAAPGTPGDVASGPDDWEPDLAMLHAVRELLIEHEQRWEDFFAAAGIRPCRLTYEDLSHGPVGYYAAIFGVLAHLGIAVPPGLELSPPRIDRQAGERAGDWAASYDRWRLAGGPDPGPSDRPEPALDAAALDRVAALPRRAHQLLGDGRLTLAEATRIARATPDRPALERVLADVGDGATVDEALHRATASHPPRLGGRLLRALAGDDLAGDDLAGDDLAGDDDAGDDEAAKREGRQP
jgi:LPS sulfotransferase NodH